MGALPVDFDGWQDVPTVGHYDHTIIILRLGTGTWRNHQVSVSIYEISPK